ncbi:MAG: hypothetical protein FWC79_07025 [Oscillospiraceae bacterium]|nr:hypothetical protein [Oscillospiraceae bacterium]
MKSLISHSQKVQQKIRRDDVYVGKLEMNLTSDAPYSYRSILFTITEDNLSYDLLYQSPGYLIADLISEGERLSANEMISERYNLSLLLQHFGYGEELTLRQIKEIRKRFFTGRFTRDNCELFGWKEIKAEDWSYAICRGGETIEITNPVKLKYYQMKTRINAMLFGTRSFSGSGKDHPLPSNLWRVLDRLGDKTFADVLRDIAYGLPEERRNNFKADGIPKR